MHAPANKIQETPAFVPDSRRAWLRLVLALSIGSIGSVGMWSVVVVLPVVQAEFAVSRGEASLAFTMMMVGFGTGGVVDTAVSPPGTANRDVATSVALAADGDIVVGGSAGQAEDCSVLIHCWGPYLDAVVLR